MVFCGTFETKGLRAEPTGDGLRITSPGEVRKFVSEVAQITFSAERARVTGQEVVYVTERAVFRMNGKGLELIEIAPGVDLERDILERMDFAPLVRDPKPMDPHLFRV